MIIFYDQSTQIMTLQYGNRLIFDQRQKHDVDEIQICRLMEKAQNPACNRMTMNKTMTHTAKDINRHTDNPL